MAQEGGVGFSAKKSPQGGSFRRGHKFRRRVGASEILIRIARYKTQHLLDFRLKAVDERMRPDPARSDYPRSIDNYPLN
jgi:hypothetical protein